MNQQLIEQLEKNKSLLIVNDYLLENIKLRNKKDPDLITLVKKFDDIHKGNLFIPFYKLF